MQQQNLCTSRAAIPDRSLPAPRRPSLGVARPQTGSALERAGLPPNGPAQLLKPRANDRGGTVRGTPEQAQT
jgi:hypothetical protein